MAAGPGHGRTGRPGRGRRCGLRRPTVSRTNLAKGEYRVLAYLFENRQFNAPNEVAADREGRIFFNESHSPHVTIGGMHPVARHSRAPSFLQGDHASLPCPDSPPQSGVQRHRQLAA